MSLATMTSTTTTYPSPPPTTNALAQSQRKRLLKSSRKLEAVLGATPLVLEIDIGGPFEVNTSSSKNVSRPPITPRTRAHRRRGQLFEGSSCSSDSSDSDCNSETTLLNLNLSSDHNDESDSDSGSYVFIPTSTPRATYQPQHIPSAVGAPLTPPKDAKNRKRSKSEAAPASKSSKPKAATVPPVPPLPLLKPGKTTSRGQPLAQPILFRLRSVPVPPSPPSHSRTHSETPSVASTVSTAASRHNKSASDDLRSPLSPVFDPSRASLISIPDSDAVREAKEREVRRKRLAKLARTLGESVPPELVFAASKPKQKNSMKASPQAPLPARKNVSPGGMGGKRKHRPRSLSVPVTYDQVATLGKNGAVVVEQEGLEPETPRPSAHAVPASSVPSVTLTTPDSTTPTAVNTSTPTVASSTQTRPRSHSKSYSHSAVLQLSGPPSGSPYSQREGYYSALEVGSGLAEEKYKPRAERRAAFASLIGRPAGASTSALGCYPQVVTEHGAFVGGRGTVSLDIQRAATPVDYVYGRKGKDASLLGEEDWRRKEREWSGEWNVRDMGDVKKKLRELKGR